MSTENQIPSGGVNPYAEHPGFTAVCSLRTTVNQRDVMGMFHRGGFGCEMTGGHCVPGDDCESRRLRADEQDKLARMFELARINNPVRVAPPDWS